MVNSKSQQDYKNYNSFYRPSADDDDLTFAPSQGVLPLYYYEYGQLRGTIPPNPNLQNLQLYENKDDDLKFPQHKTSSSFLLSSFLFLLFVLLFLLRSQQGLPRYYNPRLLE